MRYFAGIFLLLLLHACTSPDSSTVVLQPGEWTISMDISKDIIPIRMVILSDSLFQIVNGEERIDISEIHYSNDSVHFKMPRFDSEFRAKISGSNKLTGLWYNYLKKDYSIPFEAAPVLESPKIEVADSEKMKYEVWFSPKSEDEYKSLGLFESKAGSLTGTFLTETGDYRYLEGNLNQSKLSLACFDGSHLFLFRAEVKGDSLTNGVFYSGKHWEEPWVAYKNDSFQLTHPDSLTHLIDKKQEFTFSVLDQNGDAVEFGSAQFLSKVSIVQIFGSWCPNCYDENVFYKELFSEFADDGLQIIPVAFERFGDFGRDMEAVRKQFTHIGMPYHPYYGGKASKKLASEKFAMLNQIISFPTSVFIDRKGKVRKIHTGFYGPGTGAYYEAYVKDTRDYIRRLIREDHLAEW